MCVVPGDSDLLCQSDNCMGSSRGALQGQGARCLVESDAFPYQRTSHRACSRTVAT